MSLVINTNNSAINAQRHLSNNTAKLNKSLERLSSGYRINRSSDDAAGLQISENLRAQIRGSKKALDNVQDGINMLQIVDGTLETLINMTQRVRELTIQNANETNSLANHSAINEEINALRDAMFPIAQGDGFNGINPITWNASALYPQLMIQVGPNGSPNDAIDLIGIVGRMDPSGTNLTPSTVVNNNMAQAYLNQRVDPALSTLLQRRASVGVHINQLESAAANIRISIENLSTSESRIRNVDVAQESASFVKSQILQQASSSMLAQANQSPALALQLLSF